ncbi:sugar transferase [Sphingobacterium sp. SGL-16]|uniref:sugar transferase n=1 Tax=Sphingobacterium sp. SGL-16 TaxID=2710883 RepID=UPI0013EA1E9E|nr:sugar transferase [Sphingobacterium sp. SGL-16]NGM73066.1 sugar transferase [Sphingobacterium sp. SGL-16]
MYKKYLKRSFDIICAFLGLLVLSPVFILITVALFISNNGKPFFYQKRPGKNDVIFEIIKFKTMNDRKDESGNYLPDELRLTAVGNIIRKTSLDEIPQLINVLKGDMSLIGPRPLLVKYLELYSDQERKRHLVRPGITGWAQVNGRNSISWSKKFALDIYYVENLSFKLDFKILLLTIKKVFTAKDININPVKTLLEEKLKK